MTNLFINEMTNTTVYDNQLNVSQLLDMPLEDLTEDTESQQMREASKAQAKLMILVDRYSFLLDTCSVLSERFALLLEHLLPILRECGKALLIPFCVVLELQHVGQTQPEMTQRVNERIHTLLELKREGLVTICGEPSQECGDKQKVATVLEMMKQVEVLVVTQNQDLSRNLLEIGRFGLAGGKHVGVGRINSHGFLSRYRMPGKESAPGVRSDGSRVWQRCTCADCGEEFTIFDKERDYYLDNGLALPRRCPTCRKLRKMSWAGAQVKVAS